MKLLLTDLIIIMEIVTYIHIKLQLQISLLQR